MRDEARERLRARRETAPVGAVGTEIAEQGIAFAAVGGVLEERWNAAVRGLDGSTSAFAPGGETVLREGGGYDGTWIESTGTISAEVLTRFAPRIARATIAQFAHAQRDDGMIPYKITADGPAWSQIQIVTPLARTVWHHALLTDRDPGFLRLMHDAMARFDGWLARYRDTRGTGGVEAFCTFDTGHDLSPRFWFAPDRALHGDARWCDPTSATLPYVAPDLTSNVACQRTHLAVVAEELGDDGARWRTAAAESTAALYAQCFDAEAGSFYDRDRTGELVRIDGDVLLRVLANDIGDGAFFAQALHRHLMNTRRLLSHHGFTSIALDDPRFDGDASRNSWAGPVNMLAQLRAPHAFERHGHVAELALAAEPVLAAIAVADGFPQCLDPWSGAAGFADDYSPAMLWLLDALERACGLMPRPEGVLWATSTAPTRLGHGAVAAATAAARQWRGGAWEICADDDGAEVRRDGRTVCELPRGWRAVLDPDGVVRAVVGVGASVVAGELVTPQGTLPLEVAPDERVELAELHVVSRGGPAFVPPRWR